VICAGASSSALYELKSAELALLAEETKYDVAAGVVREHDIEAGAALDLDDETIARYSDDAAARAEMLAAVRELKEAVSRGGDAGDSIAADEGAGALTEDEARARTRRGEAKDAR